MGSPFHLAATTFDRESEQYLCAALLRHGKAVASDGAVGILSRLLPLLRCVFPRARFLVRLDGGFASPEVFDFLETQPRLDYVVATAKNAVLLREAEPAMLVARARAGVANRPSTSTPTPTMRLGVCAAEVSPDKIDRRFTT